jgi:hypothetical protein
MYVLFLTKKMGWATFWAIFKKTYPVTLRAGLCAQGMNWMY